jgi:SNF2 family DNA or RNA helicase
MISPFILRRTKKEVLTELPDKVDHKYLLDFNDEEQKLYMANLASVNKELRAQMKQPEVNKIAVLAMLTRLRQLCCDRRMVYDNITKPSTKILATVDLIKLMVEHKKKTLVFSSFTTLIDLLKSELDKEDITYYVLTGQTNKEQRREMVADFQTDDTSVFLISLKAGGTGLNLTAAETVIHIDPWWNVSAQNQATDRAHRIGQNANVQVYRMIMKDSIEEKILKMQEAKQDLAEGFIDGNDGSLSRMSKDDIMNLFST